MYTQFQVQIQMYTGYFHKQLKLVLLLHGYHKNYCLENIHRLLIAQQCHVSAAWLSHLFQEKLNITPSCFLQQTRLKHAKILLSQSLTLTEVAISSGFKNLRNLNNAFLKNERLLPRQYRETKNVQSNTNVLSDLENYLKKVSDKRTSSGSKKVRISCSESLPYKLPDEFGKFLEFGAASKLLKPEYRDFLKAIQQQFHFHYIRLTGIFDQGLLGYREFENHILWDFSNLDIIFEFVISNELIPALTISSIPDILSESGQSKYFGYSNVGMPSDFSTWEELISAFLEHLKEKFSKEQLCKWKIGISFLPSVILSSIGKDHWSETDYLQEMTFSFVLYQKTYAIIRSLCPQIDIGSPEGDIEDLTLSDNILIWIFRFFDENNCYPDYFPFHSQLGLMIRYPEYDQELTIERQICVSENINRIRYLFQKIKNLCNKKVLLFHTGQFNMPNSAIGETVFWGAVNIAYMLNIIPYIDMACVNLNSLIKKVSVRITASTEKYGISLMNQYIKRPFYYAFNGILNLCSPIIFQDDFLLVTGCSEKLVIFAINVPSFTYRTKIPEKVLLHMPVSMQNEYYYSCLDKPLRHYTKNINDIIGGQEISLSFSLENLLSCDYLLEYSIINTKHGSAYDEWIREGAFSCLEFDDCEHINNRTFPSRIKKVITPDAGTYTLECKLECCEIRMISLTAKY